MDVNAGQKRVKEDWENIYYYGFGGGMLLGAVLIYYKPDTRCVILPSFSLLFSSLRGEGIDRSGSVSHSIEGWARKQAQEKMAAAGETVRFLLSSLSPTWSRH